MNELRVAPEAEEELAAAVGWYEGRRTELGLELIVEVVSPIESKRVQMTRSGDHEEARA